MFWIERGKFPFEEKPTAFDVSNWREYQNDSMGRRWTQGDGTGCINVPGACVRFGPPRNQPVWAGTAASVRTLAAWARRPCEPKCAKQARCATCTESDNRPFTIVLTQLCNAKLQLVLTPQPSPQLAAKCLEQVLATAWHGLMHEGFNVFNTTLYNRDDFGWANALFAEWVIRDMLPGATPEIK